MSDCGVCLSADYDGYAEFWRVSYPKARKAHKCYECEMIIPVGAVYQYSSGKYDGEFNDYKTCAACAEIRAAFYCDGEMYGEFWSQMRDFVFPKLTEVCFDKLKTPEAKKFLRQQWMEWKGLA